MSSANNQPPDYAALLKAMQSGRYRSDMLARQARDRAQRAEAEKEIEVVDGVKKPTPRFLRPSDLEGKDGGNYDLKRALYTTLNIKEGEQPRKITRDDIIAFQENIRILADKYTKGITARVVINLSHNDDIVRANKEIPLAAPVSRAAGLVHFITNAAKGSKDPNHHVNVEFMNFSSVVSDIEKQTTTTIKNRLSEGKIKFECDCGRHKYWYRYMATIGGYGLGRQESGFPKLRNPNLMGVACKHVLRVMQFILSASGQAYLKASVEKDRTKQHGQRYAQTNKQITEELNNQLNRVSSPLVEIVPNMAHAEKEIKRRYEAADREEARRMREEIKKAAREEAKRMREETKKILKRNMKPKDLRSRIEKQKSQERLDTLLRVELITAEEHAIYSRDNL